MKYLQHAAMIFFTLYSLLLRAERGPLSAIDLMNLPAENRKLAILESDRSVFEELKGLSQNSQQSMQLRWRALMLLTEVNPKESVLELIKATSSPEWFMRNAGLLGLEQVKKGKAVEIARDLIKDKALVVRSAAVEVLGRNLNPDLRDLLWQELYKEYNFRSDKSLWIRPQILQTLSQNPMEHEGKIFAQLLKDPDQDIQISSVKALEKIHGKKVGRRESTIREKVALWQSFLRATSL